MAKEFGKLQQAYSTIRTPLVKRIRSHPASILTILLCFMSCSYIVPIDAVDASPRVITRKTNGQHWSVAKYSSVIALSNKNNETAFGFLVSVQERSTAAGVLFVSCKHVLEHLKSNRALRTTSPGEGTVFEFIPILSGEGQNVFLSDDPDLAALYIKSLPKAFDGVVFSRDLILGNNEWANLKIKEGADIVVVSPVSGYPGARTNLITTRFGKIAMVIDQNWYDCRDKKQLDRASISHRYSLKSWHQWIPGFSQFSSVTYVYG